MTKPLILLIEDNREIRLSARFVLEDAGFAVAEAENPRQAMDWLSRQNADLLLLDMNFGFDTTSGEEGLGFLGWLQKQKYDIPAVAMTAWSNTGLVVKAMQLGAGDFVEKPWNNQRLIQVLQQQLELKRLNQQNRVLAQRLESADPAMVWQSPAMGRLMQQLEAVAGTDANILLTGENGTGKSLLAHFLHLKSARAAKAFISVNMGAIPEALFESEMFGHRKGAFTDAKTDRIGRFELARGGSLFLDEIGTVPPGLQAKLLRVLESGEYEVLGVSRTERCDVRLISASNGNFRQLIADGLFRQDLYYRLNTLEFHVPALKDRSEDIEALAQHFIAYHGRKYHRHELKLSRSALAALKAYHWPGNVRELSHMMERAVLLSDCGELGAENLVLPKGVPAGPEKLPMLTLDQAELQLIRQALAQSQGNKQKAADLLGITKSSLYRRLEKYELAH